MKLERSRQTKGGMEGRRSRRDRKHCYMQITPPSLNKTLAYPARIPVYRAQWETARAACSDPSTSPTGPFLPEPQRGLCRLLAAGAPTQGKARPFLPVPAPQKLQVDLMGRMVPGREAIPPCRGVGKPVQTNCDAPGGGTRTREESHSPVLVVGGRVFELAGGKGPGLVNHAGTLLSLLHSSVKWGWEGVSQGDTGPCLSSPVSC